MTTTSLLNFDDQNSIFSCLSQEIIKNLISQGIQLPTPIQQQSFLPACEGRDLVAQSRTGSGKTLAFSLPAFHLLKKSVAGSPRLLVLTPTRELAEQVAGVFEKTYASSGFRTLAITGGKSYRYQTNQLHRGIDAIVATPGRLTDLMEQGIVDLSALEILVLDEMDEMLDFGFSEDILRIKKAIGKKVQTLLFSATFPPKVTSIAYQMVNNPFEIKVATTDTSTGQIEHEFIEVRIGKNLDALLGLLLYYNPEHAIIFCKTREETKQIHSSLLERGFFAGILNGEMGQNDRASTMTKFKEKSLRVLVATDVAARGLDISKLSHVINYNVPTNIEAYTHRAGRTGRAGASGKAWTLVPYNQRREFQFICSKINLNPTRLVIPNAKKIALRYMEHMLLGLKEVGTNNLPSYIDTAVKQHVEALSAEEIREHLHMFLAAETTKQLGRMLKVDDISPSVPTEFGAKIKSKELGYPSSSSSSSSFDRNRRYGGGSRDYNRGTSGGNGSRFKRNEFADRGTDRRSSATPNKKSAWSAPRSHM